MTVSPTRDRLVCFEDEREITSVLLRYGRAIDTRDWTLFRSCFSEDCDADYPGFGRWQGPRAIAEFMREAHAALGATLHRITNVEIGSEEGQVCARSYVDAILTSALPGGPVHRGIGWYDDRMVRTASGWRIARRRFVPVLLD